VLDLPDFVRAGNQAGNPRVYEIENAAIDPHGALSEALKTVAPWHGRDLLDLGCGAGYWLGDYAPYAATVTGVEPDASLLRVAGQRDPRVTVMRGSAEHIPLSTACMDVVHARFAYFFPPGCDGGLTEVLRVLRPGGSLVVIDNDQRWGEFASLLTDSPWAAPQGHADVTDRWWKERGASRHEVHSSWQFASRADLEVVLRLEFPASIADAWLAENPQATGLTYGYVLFVVRRDREP
jgi:ubiquinone/menaquinone biosynthesis C-methylase UbiE